MRLFVLTGVSIACFVFVFVSSCSCHPLTMRYDIQIHVRNTVVYLESARPTSV